VDVVVQGVLLFYMAAGGFLTGYLIVTIIRNKE